MWKINCRAHSRYVTGNENNSPILRKYQFSRYVTYTGMRPFSVPAIQCSIRRFWRFRPALASPVPVYVYGNAKEAGKCDFVPGLLSGVVPNGRGAGQKVFLTADSIARDGVSRGTEKGVSPGAKP